ncbi:hypothetical protein HYO65_gp058 [Tenacibaculum phage PTm1]|uniref:Uncharacterized protein n=2 Tax=Shirahamavirus PTm1 TaxID=2846435 RepID=A0A5S9HX60_9CAUD|nr:hypothetical protein HYO65_gp058 [Tenacibaculum phage PTm1]BBI90450.1 hypothetical protein [Tenacibaculum phage PTm1]BBI90758.1 hypothetical protein [Tenacibaculum phage PTm5]
MRFVKLCESVLNYIWNKNFFGSELLKLSLYDISQSLLPIVVADSVIHCSPARA